MKTLYKKRFKMNASEFYSLPSVAIFRDLSYFFKDEIFPELSFPVVPNPNSLSNFQRQTRVEIRVVKFHRLHKGTIAEREVWALASVWFDSVPCMIIRNAIPIFGSNSHYSNVYVTNEAVHKQMIKFLFSLVNSEETNATEETKKLFAEMYGGWQPTIKEITYAPLDKLDLAIAELY